MNPFWLYGAIAALVISLGGGGYTGYKLASNACDAEKVKAMEEWQEFKAELEERFRAREKQLLAQSQQRKDALYDLATRIPTYTPDDCALTPDGLQDVRDTVKQLYPGSK